MGEKIGFIIIIIIALGIGLYVYTSGALVSGVNGFNSLISAHPGSSSSVQGSSTNSNQNSFWSFLGISGSHTSIGPSAPSLSQPLPSTVISAPTNGSGAPATINPADIPAGYTASELSPYFHEVRLTGVSAGTSYNYGTITLSDYNNNSATDTIDITGWQIKSKNSGEYIPQAINIYDPSGLMPASDIRIKNGDTVYLYSSSAPFNLRLNECIGYIAHIADFNPPLPMNCPYVDQSQIENFTGACQNYIESIGACQQPNMSNPQIPRTDYACQDYLQNNFTYKSCFNAHAGDANFLSNQVWVWTGANVVDPYHDTVKLLDRSGLLVDMYQY